ncbi:unnamed protein product [Cyclocybe aegerita]|uniref:F-box domain-containing protein n=1 Tax=Cyclocybe aegerita TaxID=1973307 RepID=A0A8S0W0P4_CYCAE|nr:unnamed protein product [Cyclocybe aegerita]
MLCLALSCRSFYDAFQSPTLQYMYQLRLNYLQDTGSGEPPDQLCARVRHQRMAWELLEWTPAEFVKIPGELTAYELLSGVFVGTDGTRLSVCWLPSATQETRTVCFESVGFPVRDLAIDPNQDLVVLLEEIELPSGSRRVTIHPRSISVNAAHPHSRPSPLYFDISPHPEHGNGLLKPELQLADDVFTVFIPVPGVSRLLLWNWRAGLLVYDSSDQQFPLEACGFDMLRRDAFILARVSGLGCIDVYRFSPIAPRLPQRLASLRLPRITHNADVMSATIHSGQFQSRPTQGKPFMSVPDSRIHVFSLSYRRRNRLRPSSYRFYNLFVRSETFLKYTVLEPGVAAIGKVPDIPWGQWGECETRFMGERMHETWPRYAHGHRVVCKSHGATSFEVLDFSISNPHLAPSSTVTANGTRQRLGVNEPTVLPPEGIFRQRIVTRLPFHSASRLVPDDFSPYFMIDEDRLIGYRNSPPGTQLQVYYF